MGLTESGIGLLRLLRGRRVYKPPFWEPWFDMWGFFRRRYGDPGRVENQIRMAEDLGMAALRLGYVDYFRSLKEYKPTRGGVRRYTGGRLTSLEQLEGLETLDQSVLVEEWREKRKLINKAGLLTWIVLPWCFHAVATAMSHTNFFVKQFKVAIATATIVFGVASEAALATVIGPLWEVPSMLSFVNIALKARKYFSGK